MRNPLDLLARPRALKAPTPMEDAHTPVPLTSRRTITGLNSGLNSRGTVGQLEMMGSVGTLFGIIHRTTTSTAAVDWHLYRKAASGKDEDRVEVTSHAALDLWGKPNPFFHRQEYVELVQQHVDLTGKGFLVLNIMVGLPIEMWWARPDRMMPVPHPTKFLAGWVYTGPDGDRIPLTVQEVIPMRMPDPMDPYGGLGPVQALSADLASTRYAAEWNRNFFLNGAEPGGIVEFPESLDDDEFNEFRTRWQENHQGVNRAHRVAMLEGGAHWVDRQISQKDMQFVQLRQASRDTIMEAYTIHKAELGIAEDVNRANAEAGEVIFAKRLTVPRLERWKAALNGRLLPMYGATARDLEFDYDSPVPEDVEAERAELQARVAAWVQLVDKGADPAGAASVVGLPEIPMTGGEQGASPRQVAEMVQKIYLGVGTVLTWEEARAVLVEAGAELDLTLPAPSAPDPAPFGGPPAGPPPIPAKALRLDLPRADVDPPALDQVDHTETQATWERLLEQLAADWVTITTAQRADLIDQIIAAVDAGDLPALTELTVDTTEAEQVLADYLDRMATEAAHKVVREAMSQGAELDPHTPKRSEMADLAAVTAAIIGSGLALSAGREAMRVQAPGVTGRQVADLVEQHLVSLAPPRAELGGALTGAQNQARVETMRRGPVAAIFADERMDSNTCSNCREINGRWIGNTDDGIAMAEVDRLYPQGGYVDCLGRSRCRGTLTGVWRSQTVKEQ